MKTQLPAALPVPTGWLSSPSPSAGVGSNSGSAPRYMCIQQKDNIKTCAFTDHYLPPSLLPLPSNLTITALLGFFLLSPRKAKRHLNLLAVWPASRQSLLPLLVWRQKGASCCISLSCCCQWQCSWLRNVQHTEVIFPSCSLCHVQPQEQDAIKSIFLTFSVKVHNIQSLSLCASTLIWQPRNKQTISPLTSIYLGEQKWIPHLTCYLTFQK